MASNSSRTLPRVIKSTAGEGLHYVGEFDTVQKSIRGDEDLYRPFTPEQRFKRNKAESTDRTASLILPTPLVLNRLDDKEPVTLDVNHWKISFPRNLYNEARYLKGFTISTAYSERPLVGLVVGCLIGCIK